MKTNLSINNLGEEWNYFNPSPILINSKIKDGKYRAIVDQVFLEPRPRVGFRLSWLLLLLENPYKNEIIWKSNAVYHIKTLGLLKLDLCTCGLQLEYFSELSICYKELKGTGVYINVSHTNKYQNVDFLRYSSDSLNKG